MSNILILLLALGGFFVSSHIVQIKKKKKKFVCIVGKKCESVLYSKYNKIFGTPNEILGMLYYATISFVAASLALGAIDFVGISLSLILLMLTVFAFLFSLYLTYIQGLILRAWCDYCIASAAISTAIFAIELL